MMETFNKAEFYVYLKLNGFWGTTAPQHMPNTVHILILQ